VSDSNLPGEPAVRETPAVATPPEASPAAAFDLPKEGRRRRTTGKKKGGLSLTAMMEEMASENEPTKPTAESGESDIPAAAEGPQNVYTEHELKLALDEYTKQRHVKTAIRSMLQAQVPKILDKNTLEITVDNNIQQGYFNDEQKELVPWLRKKLDNFALRFEVKMAENVQTKKLYLPEEKFKHMVEKNPNLLYLREKLNTDLE
jgi:DNA polymerase-3 subunit gamma/tau